MVQILSKNILNLLNRKIFCLGDIMLDNYIIGNTNRISPEGPIPVLDIVKEVKMLGGVGNVVRNLSTLATETHLVSLLGNDLMSNEVEKKLNIINVNKDLVRDSNRPTITKSRYISNNQQILRVDKEKTDFIDKKIENKIFNYSKKRILKTDVVIISDYNKGLITKNLLKRIVSFANKNKKPVIIDPKSTDFDKYKGATIVTPNIKELELVAKKKLNSDKEIINISKKLIFKFNFKHLLITMGKSGMMLISKNNKNVIKFDAEAKEVFDVSGAGDTVIASIAAALSTGFDISSAVKLANVAAGIVVGKSGTATASLLEIEPYFSYEDSLYNLNEIQKHSSMLKKRNRRIIFTNGCFDILHAGHVHYLEQAKKLGDELVVGLNSDSSVKNLKGEDRPINNLDQRAKVLSSLECVDKIVSFSEATPIKLIKAIKPDVIVKGGDYKVKDVVGHKEVESWGGKVRIIPLIPGLSTTKIIRKFK